MKKILTYSLGLAAGLAVLVPPIDYDLPIFLYEGAWLYLLTGVGLLGFLLFFTKIHTSCKILTAYIFVNCFYSQAPFIAFNAFMLFVFAMYGLLAITKCDKKVLFKIVQAVFWFEVLVVGMQMLGQDVLLSFGSTPDVVFLGTVLQYMRFSTLLAVMTPILVLVDKRYIVPIIILAFASQSSTLALSLMAGVFTWYWLEKPRYRHLAVILTIFGAVTYVLYDRSSLDTALTCGRLPVWMDIIRSWVMNTSLEYTVPLSGPFDIKTIIMGHGAGTFKVLFCIFKHDANPFAQAHNEWLQIPWELGLIGLGLVGWYMVHLWRGLKNFSLHRAGLISMGIVCLFSFPIRMVQTVIITVCFFGLCEKTIQKAR